MYVRGTLVVVCMIVCVCLVSTVWVVRVCVIEEPRARMHKVQSIMTEYIYSSAP